MPRGRKKKENSLEDVISIRITKAQKELLNTNKNIKKEIDAMIRNFLNVYLK